MSVVAAMAAGCARGSGGTATIANPRVPLPAPGAELRRPGILAIAAGDGAVRVDLRRPAAGFDALLFRAPTAAAVYAATPDAVADDTVFLDGLTNGTELFFGLGVRAAGQPAAPVLPVGLVLRARPGPPVYVDARAPAAGADGRSPATAFPTLQAGLAAAGAAGGNVWLRDGTYSGQRIQLPAGVHVAGGFGAGFDLRGRDAGAWRTRIEGTGGGALLDATQGGDPVVVDGLSLNGLRDTLVGFELDSGSAEVRSVELAEFGSRGARLRNPSRTDAQTATFAGCAFHDNDGDGLSLTGAFDLRVFGSRFDLNLEEGLECSDLVAIEGETASLEVIGCRFFGNGAEGLDADLAAPDLPGNPSGRFSVHVAHCLFADNALAGLLIDEEFELAPLWSARISIHRCEMRGNGSHGVHLDSDGRSEVLVHRVSAGANAGDGLLVTSEVEDGHVLVAASVFTGNLGAGVRGDAGNKALLVSHSVVSGNAAGGVRSDLVPASVTSGIAYSQPDPYVNAVAVAGVVTGPGAAPTFVHAAAAFAQAIDRSGATLLLQAPHEVRAGQVLEVAGDGVARRAQTVTGAAVAFDSVPVRLRLPASLAVFAGDVVDEDYRLAAGSPAAGAGMAPPTGRAPDAGIFAPPGGGAAGPGAGAEAAPFWLSQITPAINRGVTAQQRVIFVFSAPIDTASVDATTVRAVDRVTGTPLDVTLFPIGDQVHVLPPAAGWGTAPVLIEFHPGVRSQTGELLASPAAIPVFPR